MRRIAPIFLACVLVAQVCTAGDDASGPIQYSVDLGQPSSAYELTAKDHDWGVELAKRLDYSGTVVHFTRTSIPLLVNSDIVEGAVYRAVERPDYFYVVPGDAMLRLDTTWPYSPGVGGFSMHSPKSKNFIVCFNFVPGGVPFLSSTPVVKGKVSWGGNDYKRF